MDINCKSCGERLSEGGAICPHCGAENTFNEAEAAGGKNAKRAITKLACVFGPIMAFIAVILILNANLLLPWQLGARRNKQVILQYASERYPNAKVVGEELNTAKIFIWNNFLDAINFEQDDINFYITAEGGKILLDGYKGARAIAQFDEIIQDGFMKPRGITAQSTYWFSDAIPNDSPYTGGLGLAIGVYDQGSTPQEVGWLYDFYEYWKAEGEFLKSYSVSLGIIVNHNRKYHIDYGKNSEYASEEDFYNAFKYDTFQ